MLATALGVCILTSGQITSKTTQENSEIQLMSRTYYQKINCMGLCGYWKNIKLSRKCSFFMKWLKRLGHWRSSSALKEQRREQQHRTCCSALTFLWHHISCNENHKICVPNWKWVCFVCIWYRSRNHFALYTAQISFLFLFSHLWELRFFWPSESGRLEGVVG